MVQRCQYISVPKFQVIEDTAFAVRPERSKTLFEPLTVHLWPIELRFVELQEYL